MRLLLVVMIELGCIGVVAAEERFALLIGNSRYEHATPLRNPENDIDVVGRSLETVGFATTRVLNATLDELNAAVDEFVRDVSRHERPVVLVYFAGHGVQRHGRNYLLPVDSVISDADMLAGTTLGADDLIARLEPIGASLQIIVLDACRDDPFAEIGRGAVSLQGGLAEAKEASGQLIAYSTAPGRTAADGDTGTSPYAAAFAETLLMPGLNLRSVFDRVREKVMERTKGGQQPWEAAATYRDFHFVAPGATVEISEVEALSWDNAVLADSAESYQRYLARFAEGRFAALARQKIDNINKDFSFRKRSETFTVVRAEALGFCGSGGADPFDTLSKLNGLAGEIVYVDIVIPLERLMCAKGIEAPRLEAVSKEPAGCYGVLYHFSEDMAERLQVETCVATPQWAPGDWGERLIADRGLVIDRLGAEGLYLSAATTPHYSYLFDAQEGQIEYAFVAVKGLVRVHTFVQEVYHSYFLEPADPAELGLTWKYQNTLEAYRKGAEQSGFDLVALDGGSGTAQGDSSSPTALWDHNGSVMTVSNVGDRIAIDYMRPREALLDSGIAEGTRLFDGTSTDGRSISGNARTFSRICGSVPYAVAGQRDGARIVLNGIAPRFDINCRQTGTRADTLVFSLMENAEGEPTAADQPSTSPAFTSFWDHNGSLMGLARAGSATKIAYVTPREAIRPAGIDAGTVLFEGRSNDGRTFAGRAYTFSSRCPSRSYEVSGSVAADHRRIVLRGRAPRLDASCRHVGTRLETMTFDLVR